MNGPQPFVFTASKISNGACWETDSILLELMAEAATIRWCFIAAETSHYRLLNCGVFFICPTIQELNVNIHFVIHLRLNEDRGVH